MAVLRLMTSSNLVGCMHRQVGGLLALEDAAGVDADSDETRPQCWLRSSSARRLRQYSRAWICRGNPVARRQRGELDSPAGEKRIAADEKGVGPLAHNGGEGRIDFAGWCWR